MLLIKRICRSIYHVATAKSTVPTRRGKLGVAGERFAERFLRDQGFVLLARNFRTRFGEIDLVMRDRDSIVAVEVKTRTRLSFGDPQASVTPLKLQRLAAAFHLYLTQNELLSCSYRIDVAAVVYDGGSFSCLHFPNVS